MKPLDCFINIFYDLRNVCFCVFKWFSIKKIHPEMGKDICIPIPTWNWTGLDWTLMGPSIASLGPYSPFPHLYNILFDVWHPERPAVFQVQLHHIQYLCHDMILAVLFSFPFPVIPNMGFGIPPPTTALLPQSQHFHWAIYCDPKIYFLVSPHEANNYYCVV